MVANETQDVLVLRIYRKVLREKNIVILSHPVIRDSKDTYHDQKVVLEGRMYRFSLLAFHPLHQEFDT